MASSVTNVRRPGRPRKYDYNLKRWRCMDWTQRTRQIAAQLGVSSYMVSRMRHLLAPHTCLPPGRPVGDRKSKDKCLLRYRNVDWTMSDREIADKLGVTKQAVNVARHALRPPEHEGN